MTNPLQRRVVTKTSRDLRREDEGERVRRVLYQPAPKYVYAEQAGPVTQFLTSLDARLEGFVARVTGVILDPDVQDAILLVSVDSGGLIEDHTFVLESEWTEPDFDVLIKRRDMITISVLGGVVGELHLAYHVTPRGRGLVAVDHPQGGPPERT